MLGVYPFDNVFYEKKSCSTCHVSQTTASEKATCGTSCHFSAGNVMEPTEGERSTFELQSGATAKTVDSPHSHTSGDSKLNWYILKLTLAADIGGLLFGYNTGEA